MGIIANALAISSGGILGSLFMKKIQFKNMDILGIGVMIVSIPLNSDSFYSIGYILLDDRKQAPLTEKFIQLLVDFSSRFF